MRLILLFAFVVASVSAKALTWMPDAALRTWANNNFPGCIQGQYIDEDHPDVQAAVFLDLSWQNNITNLMGIEAFANALMLNVSNNPITEWSGPPGLNSLHALNCGITG
ncbi:MAG: hypothetical protein WAT74_09470, partial [Flavobacteriales bacterium]